MLQLMNQKVKVNFFDIKIRLTKGPMTIPIDKKDCLTPITLPNFLLLHEVRYSFVLKAYKQL